MNFASCLTQAIQEKILYYRGMRFGLSKAHLFASIAGAIHVILVDTYRNFSIFSRFSNPTGVFSVVKLP